MSRYIGHLVNASFDSSLHENSSKNETGGVSTTALSYFQKVFVNLIFFLVQFILRAKNYSSLCQLSVNEVDALYEVYRKDFEMFGYSYQVYKDIAQSGESNILF